MKKYNVAIVGATGLVGRTFLKVLNEKNFPINELYLYASSRSAGKKVDFQNKEYSIIELSEENIKDNIDIALFSAGGSISQEYAPKFVSKGAIVVDNSSAWRMDNEIPLVVPEVNPQKVKDIDKGIIANPNCSTIQVVPPIKIIEDLFGIKRIVYSTYQAAGGAGQEGIDDLERTLKGEEPKKFTSVIAGNLIPHIDVFFEDGYTKEEKKMVEETRKILDNPNLKITATCVRVPVKIGHSVSVNVETEKPVDLALLRETIIKKEGLYLIDNPSKNEYPMPLDYEDKEGIYIGRLRLDDSVENGLNMWVVADNIRKGAASNTIQIAEELIKQGVI